MALPTMLVRPREWPLLVVNQFAEIGLGIIATLDDKRPESRVTYLAWFMVGPNIKPIHSVLKHFLRGYKVGMEGMYSLEIVEHLQKEITDSSSILLRS